MHAMKQLPLRLIAIVVAILVIYVLWPTAVRVQTSVSPNGRYNAKIYTPLKSSDWIRIEVDDLRMYEHSYTVKLECTTDESIHARASSLQWSPDSTQISLIQDGKRSFDLHVHSHAQ